MDIKQLYKWIIKVIVSCKTFEQIYNAEKLIYHFYKRTNNGILSDNLTTIHYYQTLKIKY